MINPYIYLEKDYYDFYEIFNLNKEFNLNELLNKYQQIKNKNNIHYVGFKILKDPYYKNVYFKLKSIKKIYEAGFFIDEVPICFYKKQEEFFDLNFLTTPFEKFRKKVSKEKENIFLISTGGFSPFHDGHLKMLEVAYQKLKKENINVIGGYISPSHDKYVSNKYNGTAALNIEKRISIIENKIKNIDWLEVDRWEGMYNKYEVNFTESMFRLERYLEKHLKVKIKICLVYGGDNQNFCNTFIEKGMGICVKRPTYTVSNFNFKNNYLVENYHKNNISSKSIREKKIQKSLIKKDFNYGIRDDGLIALSKLNNKKLLYAKFKNSFKDLIEYYLSKEFKQNIEFISVKKQLDISNKELKKEKLKTISLDVYVKGDYQLETSRIFEVSSEQLTPMKLVERPNNININRQIKKIPKGSYCLIEDDIVSGNTIKKIKELFKDKIKIEKYFILSNLLNKKYDDIIDIRDFLIGSEESGLVITLNNKNIRVPYVLPYVNLNTRASIPLSYQLEFSYKFWMLIKDFYININKDMKLKELNKDFIYLMNYIGFENNDKIKDICDWHINKLEIYKDMYKDD